ncbi:MAG: pilus assembly protein [Thermoleophilaceae bacterium]
MRRLGRAGGQATVELLGALPVLLILGLVLLQALAVGYAAVLAGTAAEAGALAHAAGGDAVRGARESLPGWSRAGARVSERGGTVTVRLQPPALLRVVARKLTVDADASVGGR